MTVDTENVGPIISHGTAPVRLMQGNSKCFVRLQIRLPNGQIGSKGATKITAGAKWVSTAESAAAPSAFSVRNIPNVPGAKSAIGKAMSALGTSRS